MTHKELTEYYNTLVASHSEPNLVVLHPEADCNASYGCGKTPIVAVDNQGWLFCRPCYDLALREIKYVFTEGHSDPDPNG